MLVKRMSIALAGLSVLTAVALAVFIFAVMQIRGLRQHRSSVYGKRKDRANPLLSR